jgi:lipopolysaccharide export system permease protein
MQKNAMRMMDGKLLFGLCGYPPAFANPKTRPQCAEAAGLSRGSQARGIKEPSVPAYVLNRKANPLSCPSRASTLRIGTWDMKIIDRYLLRTFLVPFFYCLTAFMMMYVIFDLFDNLNDFVDGKTPLMLVVKYYLILFPSVMIRIVPISLLLAVLYSLSSLTKNNELTAMRASGVSIIRLMIPFLSVGLFFTLVVGVVHETIGPRAAYWCYNFVREQKKSDPAAVYVKQDLAIKNQVTRRIWLVGEFDIRDYRMKQIEVIQQREDTSDAKKIRAKDAQWLDGRWWFRDLVEQVYDQDGNPMGPPRFALTEEMEELTEEPSLFLNEFKDPEFLSSLELMDYLKTHQHRERPPSPASRPICTVVSPCPGLASL